MTTHAAKASPLTVGVAKKIPADGTAPSYYYSLPKVRIFDIKGRLWLWRTMRGHKRTERAERKAWKAVN